MKPPHPILLLPWEKGPFKTGWRILVVVVLAWLIMTGCGRKGPPLPPLKEPPAQTETDAQEQPAEPTGPPQDALEEEQESPAVPPYP